MASATGRFIFNSAYLEYVVVTAKKMTITIKTSMKGKGYTMADTDNNVRARDRAELITNFFIDDSLWTTATAADAQELIRRVELFCDFHKVMINKSKSDYVAINAGDTQVRWTPPRSGKGETVDCSSTHALGDPFHKTKDGSFKYLGVYFEAKKGWAK